jgi:hypothetical protein
MPRKQEYTDPQWWNYMVIYWHENQAAITFHSDLDLSEGSQKIIDSLHLEALNQFLNMRGFNLKSFTLDDVPRPLQQQSPPLSRKKKEEEPPINSQTGKYLFPAPSDQGTVVFGFFHVEQSTMAYSMSTRGSMNRSGGSSYGDEAADNTRQLVDLINRNLDTLRQGKIPVVAATPNWLSGGAGCVTHTKGVPPIPIGSGSSCASSPGLWPISLPELDDTMQGLTGDGVTVFVLDAMPKPDEIFSAATRVSNNNLLLQKIVDQISGVQTPSIKLNYQYLGQRLDDSTSEQPKSGEDLYGRSFPYLSSDHGLFITGMVRDLAPGAFIEYIRVLNDYGVGDISGLVDTLSYIQSRMGENRDLHNQPVVINLSLGAIPSREDLARLWFNAGYAYQAEEFVHSLEDIELLQLGLHLVIQSLTELGAVVVASASNDSNIPPWNPWSEDLAPRNGPRYPAAYPEVISVGAVDKYGRAARYSNYPQVPPFHNGIATYGGSIPSPVSPVGPGGHAPLGDHGPDPDTMTTAIDVDGVIGVYTTPTYPALSRDDSPQSYKTPTKSYDWAYWSGTSFAAPIISAVAARVLQLKSSSWPPYQWAIQVQKAITTPAGESALLTGGSPLPLQTDFGFGVRMLKACQCEEVQHSQSVNVIAL